MISIDDLHKSFDGNEVLRGISLEIKKGEVVALIGGSGCGKSVLLKHVSGLMKPDSGSVTVDDKDISMLRGGELFDSMTVFENVAFPLKEKTKLSNQLVRERVYRELENVGLSGSESKYPSQISGGMVKRAALARCLVMDPEIMLFDEPTTGLDPVMGNAILNLIDACHKRLSFTAIIVTHEIPGVFDIVEKVAMIHEGLILAEGTPSQFMSFTEPVVQAFIGRKQ